MNTKEKIRSLPDDPTTKSNPLFDECVKNCDPAVMKEVSDNVDKILGRQPVEGLEEAAEEYATDTMPLSDETYIDYARKNAFIAGAKWQEEQFEKNRLAACDAQTEEEYKRETDFADKHIKKYHRTPTFSDAINYGIEWQKAQTRDEHFWNGVQYAKKQMMEEAVEGEVVKDINNEPSVKSDKVEGFKFGQKVKLIILKDE